MARQDAPILLQQTTKISDPRITCWESLFFTALLVSGTWFG